MGRFVIQTGDDFERDNLAVKKGAWYWKIDKRPGRNPIPTETGLVETNAALSTGLALVLAGLVRAGQMAKVRDIMRLAAEEGMTVLERRSGYIPSYMALHPDAEGTLSVHFGLSPVDLDNHALVGISATGKRGRKGFRNMGDAYISILRHDRAIGLPEHLVRHPKKKLEMAMADWAVAEEMDRVVKEELSRLPDGAVLLEQAGKYQREAAEDWLLRYKQSKAGVEWLEKRARVAEVRASRLSSLIQEFAKHIRSTIVFKALFKQLKGGWEKFSALVAAAEEPSPSNPVPDLPEVDLVAAEATEPAEGTMTVVGAAQIGTAQEEPGTLQAELEVRSVVLEAKVAKVRSAIEAERGKATAKLVATEAAQKEAESIAAEAREAAETAKREARKAAMEKDAADAARQEVELKLQRTVETAQKEKIAAEAQIADLESRRGELETKICKDLNLLAAMSADLLGFGGKIKELKQQVNEMEQAAVKQENELKKLRPLADFVRQFFDKLVSTGKMVAMLGAAGRPARGIIYKIGNAVGKEIPDIDKSAPEK
jgi:predicted  nucleic acid-binding Zn-ribbon protein